MRSRSTAKPGDRFSRTLARALLVLIVVCWFAGVRASAQNVGSVYLDDSPAAEEGLTRAAELAGVGNFDEAARVLQRLLDDSGELLVLADRADADLFIPVRRRVHDLLLSNARLLARYRELEQPGARALLNTDQAERCEVTRLFTTAGFEAAVRVAQDHLDRARFVACFRTLAQLDAHPDLNGENVARAASLLASCVSYLAADPRTPDDALDAARRTLAAWNDRAGVKAPDLAAPKFPDIDRELSPLAALPEPEIDALVARPLASEYLGASLDSVEFLASRISQQQRGPPPRAIVLHAVPAVAGDTLFVNDSETITAWDRYTLSRRWRVRIEPPTTIATINAAGGLGAEDCNWIAAEGRRLATVSGLALIARSSAERAISVLDTRDGAVLWTTTLSQLGPDVLSECFPRGPVVIDQGVVIVSASRNSVEKRLQGAVLVGLDLETGRLRWWRNLGSLGVVPWGMNAFPADFTLVEPGTAYRADRVGVISAVDTVSGRTLWARRLAPDPLASNGGGRSFLTPWEGNQPLLSAGRLIALSPDKRLVVSVDARTGRVLERIPAQAFNNPDYLLSAPASAPGGPARIVAVAPSQIGLYAIDGLLAEAVHTPLAVVPAPGVRGRVSVAGASLVIPVIEGVLVAPLPASGPAPEPRTVRLNRTGQSLAVGAQLIVVDDQQAHSYLLWETAEKLLEARMNDEPGNPVPAVTFAELAYQAGRQEKLVGAVDRAVSAIERDPLSATAPAVRRRLFVSLMDMIDPAPDSPAPRVKDDARRLLIARAEQLAASPAEQVVALMAGASLAEGWGKVPEAVEKYQSLLLSAALASQTYSRGGTTLPADAEATRRLRKLVQTHGREVYAVFDQEAQGKLDAAGAAPDAELERIARSYPVSTAAPQAWLELARRHRAAGKESLALWALDEALASAQSALASTDPAMRGVAESIVQRIAQSDRPRAALRMLDAVEAAVSPAAPRAAPRLGTVIGGTDLAALRQQLTNRIEETERRPAIGAPSGPASVLTGWGALEPICGLAPGAPTDRVVLGGLDAEVALWRVAPGANGAPSLEKVWSDPQAEAYLRMDARSLLVARRADQGARTDRALTRRDINTGQAMWEVPSFRALFTERSRRPFPAADERIETPLRSQVPASELVVLIDDRTMILLDRVGRAASFDYDSGRLLWAAELGVDRVYDAAMSDGALVVAGTPARPAPSPDEPAKPDESAPEEQTVCIVQVVGARTGVSQGTIPEPTDVRWVTLSDDGALAYATEQQIVLADTARVEARWRHESAPLTDSFEGWSVQGRVIVRDRNGRLHALDAATGQPASAPFDTLGKSDQAFVDASLVTLGQRTALVTTRGLVIHDAAGAIVAADALGRDTVVYPPQLGQTAAAIVETGPAESPDPGMIDGGLFNVHVVSLASGKALGQARIELPRAPSAVAIADGVIVVSCGSACVVLSAPAAP